MKAGKYLKPQKPRKPYGNFKPKIIPVIPGFLIENIR
jgi:hypothetical protein